MLPLTAVKSSPSSETQGHESYIRGRRGGDWGWRFCVTLLAMLAVGACGVIKPDPPKEEKPRESLFGPGGITFGTKRPQPGTSEGGVLGVNSFLWRASLDTISFMPVSSADPFGGVILTDWYAPPETPNERFKMNIYILGRALRADGVRVSVFREVDAGGGQWRTATPHRDTASNVENAILLRARQFRQESEATKP